MSVLFWFVGLIPDLATLRDRAKHQSRSVIYGMLALGWRGSARHWHDYEDGLPAARRPLDAAGALGAHGGLLRLRGVGIVPGWHATIFPPYFVAGAIFSGFAMVLTLAIPLRGVLRLEDFITDAAI